MRMCLQVIKYRENNAELSADNLVSAQYALLKFNIIGSNCKQHPRSFLVVIQQWRVLLWLKVQLWTPYYKVQKSNYRLTD